jgi:uncharacterized protein
MITTTGSPRVPHVWVLFGKGTGGNGQMQSLADALGWPYEIKQLRHNVLNLVPNVLLGATAIRSAPHRWRRRGRTS